jgi:hypothetical protein
MMKFMNFSFSFDLLYSLFDLPAMPANGFYIYIQHACIYCGLRCNTNYSAG